MQNLLIAYLLTRDDPESVEICYSDINCLAPEGFLTSPIMNFYIRQVYLSTGYIYCVLMTFLELNLRICLVGCSIMLCNEMHW